VVLLQTFQERLDFLRNESIVPDAEPADPSDLNGGADGDRTLDELFGSDEGDN
jgi:hypothetical protein